MVVAYTVVAASVIVENIVTVTGGISVQVPFLDEGNVALGPGGLRLPLRRPVGPVPIGIEELALGMWNPDEGPVPVGPITIDELAVGNGKLADGTVPVGRRKVEFAVGKGKLADGAMEVLFRPGTPVLRETLTLELPIGVAVGGVRVPERSKLGIDPEYVLGAVPVGPMGIETLGKPYGVVGGLAKPERFPSVEDAEKGLEVVALADSEGEPLGNPVAEGRTYAPLELLYRGIPVGSVPLIGKDGVRLGKGVDVGDESEPERPAFEIESENGVEAVR